MTYSRSAETTTAVTVVPSARAFSTAALHRPSEIIAQTVGAHATRVRAALVTAGITIRPPGHIRRTS